MPFRQVRVHISSGRESPSLHQPLDIQLSVGDKWIAPAPYRFPPELMKDKPVEGSRDPIKVPNNDPKTHIYNVTYALWAAFYRAGYAPGAIRQLADKGNPKGRHPE